MVSTHGAITTGGGVAIGGWVSQSNACHGFVERNGAAYQYKDFDRVAYGMLDGNYKGGITWETWDGLRVAVATKRDVNVGNHDRPEGTWTDQQCERLADIAAFDQNELGIPAVKMGGTRDRGHGVHGTGIPNRETMQGISVYRGPDRWSTDNTKPCPGDKRIKQYFGPNLDGGDGSILARARVIAAGVRAGRFGYLPVGDVDLRSALARGVSGDEFDRATPEDIRQAVLAGLRG